MAGPPRHPREHLKELAAAAAVAGLAAASCARPAPIPAGLGVGYQLLRHGPDRLSIPYSESYHEAKRAVFERINRDRAIYGYPPLQYEPRAALVGDRFCLDTALAGSWGHWDTAGRAPYVRWGEASGVDYHIQNSGAYSDSGGTLGLTPVQLGLLIHESMMDETPPHDGHRRAILDPWLTHVGIGMARVSGEFRLTQEFTRVAFEWMEAPDRPVATGAEVVFGGKPLQEWEVGLVEIRYEPFPKRLRLPELFRRGGYGYPRVVDALRPSLPAELSYYGGGRGDFDLRAGGEFRASFRLTHGPGHYFIVCYTRRPREPQSELHPATAIMVTATS
jgi:uncharacterized protein YkwD